MSVLLPPAASPQCVWTRSASGSLQSVGNIFPFTKASRFAYLQGSHQSLLGEPAAWPAMHLGYCGEQARLP